MLVFFQRVRQKNSVGFFGYCLLDPVLIVDPSHPDPGLKENINLNFYLHTSLWYLKRFFGASKDRNGPHKTIWGTTKKCKIIFKLDFILNFFWRIWDSVYVNTLPLGRVSRTSFTLQSFENETAEEWVLSNCNSI